MGNVEKSTSSKKMRCRRGRVSRSHRPHKRISKTDYANTRRSHSTTSSLEALNSESNLDLGSIEEDLKGRLPRESQSHEVPRTQMTGNNTADTSVPARTRILGNDTWYDRVVQAAITSATDGMVQQQQPNQNQTKTTPSWFKNLQALNSSLQSTQLSPDSKKPPKKKIDGLDPASWTKATETARKNKSEKTNHSQFQTVDPKRSDLAAKNNIVFGNKMQPKRLPFLGGELNTASKCPNPKPNLLFGNTSPYFSWKPGMLLSPDRLPIPGVNKADRMRYLNF